MGRAEKDDAIIRKALRHEQEHTVKMSGRDSVQLSRADLRLSVEDHGKSRQLGEVEAAERRAEAMELVPVPRERH